MTTYFKRGWGFACRWLQARSREATHCRHCDDVVRPFEDHCPRCGVKSPASLSVSPLAFAAVVGAVLIVCIAAL
jgi:hypothetical protein